MRDKTDIMDTTPTKKAELEFSVETGESAKILQRITLVPLNKMNFKYLANPSKSLADDEESNHPLDYLRIQINDSRADQLKMKRQLKYRPMMREQTAQTSPKTSAT